MASNYNGFDASGNVKKPGMQYDQWGNPAYMQVNMGLGNVRTDQNPLYGRDPGAIQGAGAAVPGAGAAVTGGAASGGAVTAGTGAGNAGSLSDLSGRVSGYLDQAAPTMSQTNRFEPALAQGQQRLNSLLDDPNSIQQSAAYKFRVGQGQEALQRQMAAKGMLGSGNRLMELTKYGQDMGSQEYGAQFDRLNSMNQGNAANWLGDKGANTAQFSALAGQHTDRGGLLSNLVNSGNTAQATANQFSLGQTQNANQAQSIANQYSLGMSDKLGWRY